MLIMSKILTGAAGLAMVAGAAAPAFAQSYPYNNYGNSNGNVVGQVLNQVLGGGAYGQYGQGNDRLAVDQCARAAQARVSQAGYNGYNQGYNGQGYRNDRYNQAGAARVVGITSVERRSNGLKVSGVMASGNYRGAYGNQAYNQGYNQGYGNQGYGNQGYGNQGYGNQGADLRFSCRVDHRGYVSNVDIKHMNQAYRRGY